MPEWLRHGQNATTLILHIQPGARTTEIVGPHGDALKIRLAAPPVDGKANAALITYIAERLGVAKSCVHLKSGQTSRRKVLELSSTPSDTESRLTPAKTM